MLGIDMNHNKFSFTLIFRRFFLLFSMPFIFALSVNRQNDQNMFQQLASDVETEIEQSEREQMGLNGMRKIQ